MTRADIPILRLSSADLRQHLGFVWRYHALTEDDLTSYESTPKFSRPPSSANDVPRRDSEITFSTLDGYFGVFLSVEGEISISDVDMLFSYAREVCESKISIDTLKDLDHPFPATAGDPLTRAMARFMAKMMPSSGSSPVRGSLRRRVSSPGLKAASGQPHYDEQIAVVTTAPPLPVAEYAVGHLLEFRCALGPYLKSDPLRSFVNSYSRSNQVRESELSEYRFFGAGIIIPFSRRGINRVHAISILSAVLHSRSGRIFSALRGLDPLCYRYAEITHADDHVQMIGTVAPRGAGTELRSPRGRLGSIYRDLIREGVSNEEYQRARKLVHLYLAERGAASFAANALQNIREHFENELADLDFNALNAQLTNAVFFEEDI